MKLQSHAVIVAAGFSLLGCASLAPPKAEDMTQVPTVRFGDSAPAGKDFVAYFPAGAPLPVVASIGGTLFDQKAKEILHVTLKRDVYVFKQWVSFDGKSWVSRQDAIDGKFEIRLPGVEDGKNPGAMKTEFNLK